MKEYSNIKLEDVGELTWIVLSRPDKANALSSELMDELADALHYLESSGGKVIGLRGEGRGFSAGNDLGQVSYAADKKDPVADRERLAGNVKRYLQLWDHPKPIIAAVHGYCAAASTLLCVYADITIVADDVRISEPSIPIGGGFIAPQWSALVGPKRAKEFAFIPGNRIDGKTAVEWGWANHSVPESELIAAVESLAERIAKTPADVLRIKKLSINKAAEAAGFRAASDSVAEMDALLHLSPEVLAVRERLSTEGLKAVMKTYRVEPSVPLIKK
jgi:enoyl-CoA hydratase